MSFVLLEPCTIPDLYQAARPASIAVPRGRHRKLKMECD
jgi:hypothetical protein